MKKILSLALVLLMLAGCLTGCVSSYTNISTEEKTEASAPAQEVKTEAAAPAEQAEAPVEEEPKEIDIKGVDLEVWYAVSGTSGEMFTKHSQEFSDEYGVNLNLSYSGGSSDTATKVSAALLTDTQPDVALMYAGPLYTGGNGDYSTGELMLGEDFNMDDIYEGMLDYCTYMGDGICAVPYGISTQVLFYNKDILAAAGVDMTNPPKTWSEFYDVCKTVLEKGNLTGNEEFSAFDTTDEAWLFKSMLMQNGCEIVENNDGKIVPIFNNAEAVAVADYWYSLVESGIMTPGQHNNAENKFLSGNLAFVAASSNRVSRWTGTTSFELGAIEMPYFTRPSLALGGNVLVILTKDPVKKAAAWKYICYLTGEEKDTEFALGTGYLPIHKSAMENEAVKTAIEGNEMYAVAFEQLKYTWAYTHFEQMGTMDTQINSLLGKLEKGRGTAQELLDKGVSNLQKEIDEG